MQYNLTDMYIDVNHEISVPDDFDEIYMNIMFTNCVRREQVSSVQVENSISPFILYEDTYLQMNWIVIWDTCCLMGAKYGNYLQDLTVMSLTKLT